jgi:hypothetical protein
MYSIHPKDATERVGSAKYAFQGCVRSNQPTSAAIAPEVIRRIVLEFNMSCSPIRVVANVYAQMFRNSGIFCGILLTFQVLSRRLKKFTRQFLLNPCQNMS